jgi:hypothetical protein
MTLDMKPHLKLFRAGVFLHAGWMRELWEWLLAAATVGICSWIFRAMARAVF